MLTDEHVEDLLRFEFGAGAEPDATRVVEAVTREISRSPRRVGSRRVGRLADEATTSVGVRRWTSAHRWRLALPAGAVVVTTSVLAGFGIFSSGPVALNIENVAYRTTSAVTTAASSEVAYAHIVVTNPSGAVVANYDWWSQSGNGRIEQLNADGSPVIDTSWSDANGVLSGREVDYASQTWHTTTGEVADPSSLGDFNNQLALGHVIQNQLSNGRTDNVQSTTLNGEAVLELSGSVEIYHAQVTKFAAVGNTGASGDSGNAGDSGTTATQNSSPANNSVALGSSGSIVRPASASAADSKAADAAGAIAAGRVTLSGTKTEWTVWVDPTSYLPVQMVETTADGTTTTSSIEWLATGDTNLGQLIAPIPSGFAEVAAGEGQASPAGDSGS